MLNQVMFVGRLVNDPTIKTTENGKKVSNITIAVPRSYKNENGEYDTDFIDCVLWNNIAENTVEYCKKGDLIGIQGRVETNIYENESGEKRKTTNVVAEKIKFITNYKEKEEAKLEEMNI